MPNLPPVNLIHSQGYTSARPKCQVFSPVHKYKAKITPERVLNAKFFIPVHIFLAKVIPVRVVNVKFSTSARIAKVPPVCVQNVKFSTSVRLHSLGYM